ncbi:unannotated protein [freshwater metagenome]|uniref:Unannotated protein n=1 Tax=freshwater metagenome TaxID=449393 RepID=A0A6J7RGV6_9ZZZZ
MHVHLKTEAVEFCYGGVEQVGLEEGDSAVVGVAAAAVAVGLQHRAGVVLKHSVGHDLDGRGVERASRHGFPGLHEAVDLLETAIALPPQRPNHVRREPVGRGEASVGRGGVGRDPGVLPGGDAVSVEEGLCVQQRALPVDHRRNRQHVVVHRVGRTLVEGSGGLSGDGIALDSPVDGVGGVAGDTCQLERPTVDPGPVHIAVKQEHGPIGYHRVEVLLTRSAAGEVLHGPATADDPLVVGVRVGVRSNRGEVVVATLDIVEKDVHSVATAEGRMDVRVLEPRNHHASWQVAPHRARAG